MISRHPARKLIGKRIGRSPCPILHAIKCSSVAGSSAQRRHAFAYRVRAYHGPRAEADPDGATPTKCWRTLTTQRLRSAKVTSRWLGRCNNGSRNRQLSRRNRAAVAPSPSGTAPESAKVYRFIR
jgi:hypothetical protein